MELFKTISASGVFERVGRDNNKSVTFENSTLKFYRTGQVHLELDKETLDKVGLEMMLRPCKEGYRIAAQSDDGLEIAAIVSGDTRSDPDICLLRVVLKKPVPKEVETIIAVEYGIAASKPIHQPTILFPKASARFSVKPMGVKLDKLNIESVLTSVLRIEPLVKTDSTIDSLSVPNFEYCCGVIQFMFSIAKGELIESFYTRKYNSNADCVREFWPGRNIAKEKKKGSSRIQPGEVASFIQKVFENISFELIEERCLFPALYWYVDSFGNAVTYTQLALLFVCLESFVSKEKKKKSLKLVPTSILRKIRAIVEELLEKHKEDIPVEGKEKFDIFSGKVTAVFLEGGLNKSSPFAAKVETLLEDLKIEYLDLFPDMSTLIEFRNDIVHRGQSANVDDTEAFKFHMRLDNLISRIILKLLAYEGTYIERDDFGNLQYKKMTKIS